MKKTPDYVAFPKPQTWYRVDNNTLAITEVTAFGEDCNALIIQSDQGRKRVIKEGRSWGDHPYSYFSTKKGANLHAIGEFTRKFTYALERVDELKEQSDKAREELARLKKLRLVPDSALAKVRVMGQ